MLRLVSSQEMVHFHQNPKLSDLEMTTGKPGELYYFQMGKLSPEAVS